MFSGMVEIDNLGRMGEVFLSQPSNPASPISQDHHLLRSVHPASLGKGVKQATELFGAQASCHILDGSRFIDKDPWHQFRALTTGNAFKDGPCFDLAIHISFALGFSLLHGHASPTDASSDSIGLDIQTPDDR